MTNQKLIDIQNAKALLEGEGYKVEEPVKPVRVGVTDIRFLATSDCGDWYKFHVSGWALNRPNDIPASKIPTLKQAIERVLNDDIYDGPGLRNIVFDEIGQWETWLRGRPPRKYTQEQLDKAIKDAFEAGRYKYGGLIVASYKTPIGNMMPNFYAKYAAFDDYKQHLQSK